VTPEKGPIQKLILTPAVSGVCGCLQCVLGSGDDDGKKENVAEATAKSCAGFTRIVRFDSLVQWQHCGFIFEGCLVQVSVETPAILTDVYLDFPHSRHTNSIIVSCLGMYAFF
jgi:hypothetical protein